VISEQGLLLHVGSSSYQPAKPRELARRLGATGAEYADFRRLVKRLVSEGKLIRTRGARIATSGHARFVVGKLRLTSRGYGYVTPEESPEIRISVRRRHIADAMDGDIVMLELEAPAARRPWARTYGRVVRIITRHATRFVGTFEPVGQGGRVAPDGQTEREISVPDAAGAARGDKVVVDIGPDRRPREAPTGRVVEVLGDIHSAGVDVACVMRNFDLPAEFPDEVIAEAEAIEEELRETDLEDRLDLRDEVTFTIDPEDAEDFDDAISITRRKHGWQLGVHIADVSHYVRPAGALDAEACSRGLTVYLPGAVIPMLPERLSNDLCSLKEHRARLAKTVLIDYDNEGACRGFRLRRSVIRSCRRMTYGEVQSVFEGDESHADGRITEALDQMRKLAAHLRRRRLERGAIELVIPRPHLLIDDRGEVARIGLDTSSESHRVVEDFMLAANQAVAEFLDRHGVHFIRRIHPAPDDAAIGELAAFAGALGMSVRGKAPREIISSVLAQSAEHPAAFSINMATLRTLTRAEYSLEDEAHYALALDIYNHFTSPIRRYPDLYNHQILDYLLTGRAGEVADVFNLDRTRAAARSSSFLERRAGEAENALFELKVLRLLEGRTGEVLDGLVTGVKEFGVFVQLAGFYVDGMIHVKELGREYQVYDPRRIAFVGAKSGRRICLGQRLKVRIVACDAAKGMLQLAIA